MNTNSYNLMRLLTRIFKAAAISMQRPRRGGLSKVLTIIGLLRLGITFLMASSFLTFSVLGGSWIADHIISDLSHFESPSEVIERIKSKTFWGENGLISASSLIKILVAWLLIVFNNHGQELLDLFGPCINSEGHISFTAVLYTTGAFLCTAVLDPLYEGGKFLVDGIIYGNWTSWRDLFISKEILAAVPSLMDTFKVWSSGCIGALSSLITQLLPSWMTSVSLPWNSSWNPLETPIRNMAGGIFFGLLFWIIRLFFGGF